MGVQVVIGLGSNIKADVNIPKAISELKALGEVLKESEVLETKPIGITNQNDFSNSVVLMQVELLESNLKQALKRIEDKLGRDRSRPKFGPREIDLDIIVYDGVIVDDDYYSRDFLQKLVAQVWAKK
ncbi:2-amino-4-hydroxy-6-hydroxymethyldihydropteridine diphosphokinase [Carboxylicivirga sp. A043]|uniref:2-amino-4-hydroxy-6- hydroxymethyldihydropteridine diphosphokinase n=1 Tax=Carboxylicivirga litoralis TaxID=2816963 RepID=UPI0021CB8444|nr:2-amino-4-hydroxy-6-hydroxymethyldihydropteridine diphosphokinase [Carboxylicivirga sp. A043]MCU4157801.1 2-amino-4-hydroxy-6-hydroxymethyldihydropteridine diphosphokinase [Carboxylicivirga sp. A043]